jgi:HK97 family phage major capsid protein
MAELNLDKWVPEEFDSDVIQKLINVSVVERIGRREPMGSNIKSVPRSIGIGIDFLPKGGTYTEDTTTADEVVLTAKKLGRAVRLAEEDVADSLVNAIRVKQDDFAVTFGKTLDNGTLAVTAAAGSAVPFNSVYYALTQSNANTGYTGNANLVTVTAAPTYAQLSTAAQLLENSDFYSPNQCQVIAHPRFKALLRGILDTQNRPIFIDYNTPDVTPQSTLFGLNVNWSLGLRTSGVATPTATGAYGLIFCNPNYLILGVRSGPETANDIGPGFLTDDLIVKFRARRGFAVGNEFAFSMLLYSGT